MSASEITDLDNSPDWFQRLSDRANAILVKETRQAFKSKQFVATFMLMLIGAWLVSVFGMLNAGPALEYGATGRTFFFWFYMVLAVATVLIVPFGAFSSLMQEQSLNTYDLLNITTLSPRQIVWGKLWSAMVQLFIFYSAITPFIAFASLLQGFDAPTAAFMLVITFFGSILLCMLTLMISSMSDSKRTTQGLLTLATLFGLGMLLIMVIGGSFEMIHYEEMNFNESGFWWATAFVFLGALSYFLLFQQVTTARLTFESGNRSSGIRLICMGQFLVLWICFGIAVFWIFRAFLSPDVAEGVMVFGLISCLHWGFVGLFSATEENFLSRRIRRDLPDRKFLRALYVPFLPGGSRGYLYILLNLFLLWWVAVIMLAYIQTSTPGASGSSGAYLQRAIMLQFQRWDTELGYVTGMICYIVIYTGIASALSRWFMRISEDITAVHVRVIMVLVVLGGMLTPMLLTLIKIAPERGYSLWYLSEPFTTMNELERGSSGLRSMILTCLMIIAFIVVAVNAKAIWMSVKDILESHVKPRRIVPPEPTSPAV